MNSYPIQTKPFGEHAILIEWPNEIERAILDDILIFAEHLKKTHLKESSWEMVPAYNSLTLINREENINYVVLSKDLISWYDERSEVKKKPSYLWKLPVCYDLEFGIDLEEVAKLKGKSIEQIITLHTSCSYTVYGIGFLPGFMYLGGVPRDLETPRKAVPRLHVAKGAVGLAGKQTGIYPQESPGGWNIIGNCPVPIFDASKENPCFVTIGDSIQFYAITRAQYDLHIIQAEVGLDLIKKIAINA
jgi:KipI family sensor histidine kinase inhibitor